MLSSGSLLRSAARGGRRMLLRGDDGDGSRAISSPVVTQHQREGDNRLELTRIGTIGWGQTKRRVYGMKPDGTSRWRWVSAADAWPRRHSRFVLVVRGGSQRWFADSSQAGVRVQRSFDMRAVIGRFGLMVRLA
ncbi:octaprenyl-diphosphate synthase [Striga asiatica]|uniref:Octaprenyl-diphosphate synthase n=1 Tax=Striga asiatica TaxID=4170 RepID=A0A5A7Q2D5_STRAF|nr:octaprenyl-diphosphate synthase [Striga asiatica]